MRDFGRWNDVPVWDRWLADKLMPLAPVASGLLIATALLILWIAIAKDDHPELQILALAFIWSP